MKKSHKLLISRQLLIAFAAIGLMALAGCGGDEDTDACADVDCAFGICDGSTGQCINPDNCEVDNDCVAGFECGSSYVCEPLAECSEDTDCDAGVCSDGACVNPDTCETNGDCLDRTYCGYDNTCRADPCLDVICQRGVCDRGTDNCVSADTCTTATEATNCVAGDKCAQGTCKPQATFCDDFECERGECSFAEAGCVSADDCGGDDANCLDEEFCNDQNECRADKCVEANVDCGGNGVCQPATGECENAVTCESTSDCTADHVCVEGTCTLTTGACGDADGDGGCPGNRICEYDEDTLEATCTEPEFCETSLDCDDGRQCGGYTCLDAVSCTDDIFEPNDASGDATAFLSVTGNNSVSASLCSGDTDVYAFTSGGLVDELSPGELLVDVNVPARDRGLGELEVVVTDEDGNEVTEATANSGTARVQQRLSVIDHGDFTVEVRGADGVGSAGVRYDLSINFLPTATVDACNDAEVLTLDQPVVSDTANSNSFAMGSSCTSAGNLSSETIYALTLDAPQEVTFIADPVLSTTHLSLSVRSRCTQASTEQACANNVAAGELQALTTVLGAGTHFVIVQAPEGEDGGQFELSASTSSVGCASDYCADASTSFVCTPSGTRYTEVNCDSGCVPTTGRCNPAQGNTCLDADLLDSEGLYSFDLLQLEDAYNGAQAGCVDSRADGPDQTFQVEVPAQTALTATATFTNEVEGSLYLVDDCTDVASSCVEGVTGSTDTNAEELIFANSTDNPRTLNLIIDTAAGQLFGPGELEIVFTDIICEPGTTICSANAVDRCNSLGTAYAEVDACGTWGCDSGSCQRPNTCADAFDITPQIAQSGAVSVTDSYTNFTNDFSADMACGLTASNTGGEDLWFKVDLLQGDLLHARVESTGGVWSSVAVVTDCSDAAGSCQAGDGVSSSPAELYYSAPTDETVWVLADNDGVGTVADVIVDIDVQPGCNLVNHTATCTTAGNEVEYCTSPGVFANYTCPGGTCNSGLCDIETGEFCYDAENLTTGAQQVDGTTKTIDWSMYGSDQDAGVCGLTSSDLSGADAYFRVDLLDGEILSATLDPGASSAAPALLATTNCSAPDLACGSSDSQSGGPAQVAYRASGDETVFLIATSDTATPSVDFTLDAEITDSQCDPSAGTTTCAGANDLQYCEVPGLNATYTCVNGCAGDSCANPTSENCFEAQDLTADAAMASGTTITGTWNDFTSDHDSYSGCSIASSRADGQDLFYKVDLAAGETLDASIASTGIVYPLLAIAPNCSDVESTCMASASPSSTSASLSYTATNAETVRLIVDNDWPQNTGDTFDLDVTITP